MEEGLVGLTAPHEEQVLSSPMAAEHLGQLSWDMLKLRFGGGGGEAGGKGVK
jgi:hypothetical protein